MAPEEACQLTLKKKMYTQLLINQGGNWEGGLGWTLLTEVVSVVKKGTEGPV